MKTIDEITKEKEVWLVSISRGFGGDNAIYETHEGIGKKFVVAVSWALLSPYITQVFYKGELIAQYNDREYIQPHEAMAKLGFIVHGSIDFSKVTQ